MSDTTIVLEDCLERLKNGDLRARDELVERAARRLIVLAERMLRDFPGVARWEQAEDLFQQAAMRLHRSLGTIVPTSVAAFLRLGALQLRRELRDMARHYYGPNGHGANTDLSARKTDQFISTAKTKEPFNSSVNPEKLALWTEFHAAVEKLPEAEKQVFDLLWYHELSQSEAAKLLDVSERQVRRYWQSARLRLQEQLGESGLVR